MKEQIALWEKELQEITGLFRTSFGALTPEELNRKPDPQTWSIAENIQHLIILNESYYRVVRSVRNNNQHLPFIAKFSFFTNLLGNSILKSVAPGRKKKVKTFPMWEPNAGKIKCNILELFEKHQQEFIAFIKSCEDLLNRQTLVNSPANKMIVYKLEKAFEIMVTHERRHYNQALEVWQRLQQPVSVR